MTFSFYHSLVSQPRELDEAARLFRLTKWQRFWKLDVPQSMIGLVWNGMMSFGGGWFFLVAAESISVLNQKYALPGIGSYVAAASADGDLGLVLLAIVVMVVMVLGVNFFFWRPLVAWSEKFRNETTESAERPRSIVLRRAAPIEPARCCSDAASRPVGRLLDRITRPFGLAEHPLHADRRAAAASATSCSRSWSAACVVLGCVPGRCATSPTRSGSAQFRTCSCSAATRSCASS